MAVIFTSMRKVLAAFLLFCVGIMVSASATPVRVCLLEMALNSSGESSDCCDDCSPVTKKADPCCHDLTKLPDSPVPQDPIGLPPVMVADLPPVPFVVPPPVVVSVEAYRVSGPIRGPTAPIGHRSVLGVWRL